jgi:hypothetical protein
MYHTMHVLQLVCLNIFLAVLYIFKIPNMSIANLKLILSVAGLTLFTLSTPTVLTAQDLRYGTSRVPRSCPSRSEPKTGAITAKQAEQYFTCHVEKGDTFDGNAPGTYMNLVTDLTIEVVPKPRRARTADVVRAASLGTPITLNTEQPLYDIRGSYKSYFCNRYTQRVEEKQNCTLTVLPNQQGICFKNNFNDWYCLLSGPQKNMPQTAPPQ